ncbi:MAG: tail fiber domain-containing protein [Ferruginibacter sp.]
MKKFLPVTLLAILFFYAVNTNAQVTKLGTNALANNTASGIFNTGIGYNSLNSNTIGNKNTGIGANTLRFNIDGIFNTAGGYASLYKNESGSENAAYGLYSLFSNITGSFNTAMGTYTLQANTVGGFNTATGYDALSYNKTGDGNTAVGYRSLSSNTGGHHNVAMGMGALTTNTTGGSNIGIGFKALYYNNASGNEAIGAMALSENTTGMSNLAIGGASMANNVAGSYNTATGDLTLRNNTNGSYNTGNGNRALYLNSTGSFNTGTGNHALATNTGGSYNTAIGDHADVMEVNLTNATAVGYGAVTDRSNKVRVGNNLVTSIGGQVGWSTFSDSRYKNSIKEDIPGLAFINSLRPVTYTVNVKGLNEYYNRGRKVDAGSGNLNKPVSDNIENTEDNAAKTAMEKSADAAAKISYNGFVAQEVETAAKKLNFDFSGVDKPESNDGLYGLRYDNFIAPLVKAVQELAQQNTELKKELEALKSIVLSGDHPSTKNTVILSAASFEQNVPNPFTNTTTINYNLPQQYSSAKIILTDKNGRTLKEVSISGMGKGSLKIDSSLISSGAYNYSLYVNEKLIDTKQMLLVK